MWYSAIIRPYISVLCNTSSMKGGMPLVIWKIEEIVDYFFAPNLLAVVEKGYKFHSI
jgi:hypothetical protein